MERLISCRMLQFFLDNSLISYTPPNTDWKLYWPTFIPHVHQWTCQNIGRLRNHYKVFCRWFQDVRRDYWYCWHHTVTSRPGQHGTVGWDMAVKTVHWQMLCSTHWTMPDCFLISIILVTVLHSLWSPASRCYTLSWSRSHYCQQLSFFILS